MSEPTAEEIIELLALKPHPEGGFYRQTWEGLETPRASGTAIYFLLKAGAGSHWHRVDATEIWHYYAGAPLCLRLVLVRDLAAAPRVLGSPNWIVPGAEMESTYFPQVDDIVDIVCCELIPEKKRERRGLRGWDGLDLAKRGL